MDATFMWIIEEPVRIWRLHAETGGPAYFVTETDKTDPRSAVLTFGEVSSNLEGRVLVNGQDYEFDERIWGLTDEIIDRQLGVGDFFDTKPEGEDV